MVSSYLSTIHADARAHHAWGFPCLANPYSGISFQLFMMCSEGIIRHSR